MTARVLLLDIERVSGVVGGVWELGDRRYIDPSRVIRPPRTICFAYKWWGDNKTHFSAEWQSHGHEGMIQEAWQVLDEATHLVGWNSQAFDLKHLKSAFFEYGMTPPSPLVNVDLMRVVKREFSFLSNRLAYISEIVGLEGKAESSGIWRDLESEKRGVVKRAQQKMRLYNERDVELTEEMLNILLPWCNNLNLPLYEDDVDPELPLCPNCGGGVQRRGKYQSKTRTYQRYHCPNCGAWSKGKRSIGTVETVGI